MSTAQLQLPLDQAERTQQRPSGKSQGNSASLHAFARRNRVHVQELLTHDQDVQIVEMAHMFVDGIASQDQIEDDVLLMNCIRMRNDTERKQMNCFIAYEGTTPIGFLVGVTTPALYARKVVAEQKLWYVKPTRRGSVAATLLIRAFEAWARINGATQIYTGTANFPQHAERTSKLLEHIGYARTGALHVKEI